MAVRARTPTPVAEVEAGRRRRAAKAPGRQARAEWRIKEVSQTIALTMRQRVFLATHLLKDRVVRNISTSVVKGTGPRGGRVVTGRSVSGEYPHADTKQLLKGIFEDMREVSPGVFEGYVGTPHDYGLILETKMGRLFLVESLNEMTLNIRAILSGPIA